MAVTSVVDVSPLQQNFSLQVYDQLMQPEVYEAAHSAHVQQAAAEAAGKWSTDSGILYSSQTPPLLPDTQSTEASFTA